MPRKGSLLTRTETVKTISLTKKETADTPNAAIDFPAEGEAIKLGQYTVRVGAPHATEVQVSVNSSDWQTCRTSVGYHWYDWSPTKAGKYKLIARYRSNGSDWTRTNIRTCAVTTN
ncbi:MAG: hypothetical protein HY747_05450 [Elusimicrobia bacterium]|nr:hypothetical protein [Elusimicrobiota bacterium]